MGFQVSPGVNVSEIDLTTGVPAVSTTEGGIAGHFSWGPVSKRVLVDSEATLVETFSKPDANTATDFFTAANFLAYGNKLWVVRAAVSTANNASTAGVGRSVKNEDDYIDNHSAGVTGGGDWVAKYPGLLGNSLKVSVCTDSVNWSSLIAAALTYEAANTQIGTGSSLVLSVAPGDILTFANSSMSVSSSVSSVNTTVIIVATAPTVTEMGTAVPVVVPTNTVTRNWEYHQYFDTAPGTSAFATTRGGSSDEMHIAVIDEDGLWSGASETVIERFAHVSYASDAKTEAGASNYYKEVVNSISRYIWWAGHPTEVALAGGLATSIFASSVLIPIRDSLSGGTDGALPTNAEKIAAYGLFASAEDVDVSLLMGSDANATIVVDLINNIAEVRKDLIVCLSPEKADVVNNSNFASSEAEDIIAFRNTLPSTSYAVMDSGWKYQYDKYNDLYRYVPLNGDTAGLMVRTDSTRDPWFSPAGFNRGNIKNVIKLPYNPRKAQRDLLYKAGVNPVVSFPGRGTVLFGDKTLLAKPSAFAHINVRRLFIVLEKAIAVAADFSLFEFNDEFTRAQFRNLVEPFLRDVQGRRGIFDFRVVSDTTNNTPEVIDRHEFVGDIYIKPSQSINYINLNFVAARTGVDFQEIIGNF